MLKKSFILMAALLFGSLSALSAQDQETVWKSKDESLLIQVIEKPGDAPEDIFIKNLACKRLAVVGTDAAIPALTAMLPNEKLNFNARTALEAMPGASVDDALIGALTELNGKPLVGVIDTLAVRSVPSAVQPLADLLAKTEDPAVKKAIYIAWGYIATDESITALKTELGKEKSADFAVNAALADALMNAAETCMLADDYGKAIEIYDAVAAGDFPAFAKNGAAYNGLLARKADAVGKLAEKLASENGVDFEIALKTIREYTGGDAEPIVNAVLNDFPKLNSERQALVIRALGDRKDEASKKLVLPFAADLIRYGEGAVQDAAVQAVGACGSQDPSSAFDALSALIFDEKDRSPESWSLIVKAVSDLPDGSIDEKFGEWNGKGIKGDLSQLTESDKNRILAQMKIFENRRVALIGPELLKMANQEGVDPVIRDNAVAALSEIVSLSDLGLLVQALENEENAEKVDWNLRAACTRLPREACAAEVVKMFDSADADGKAKLLNLLKQIGGPTALTAVEKAAYVDETADKATEILGQWNTPEDAAQLAAACLKLAKEGPSAKYRTRGIRSYIRIPRQFDIPVNQKIQMAKIAFNTATRPDDKILIFEIFKRIIEVASVKAALSYSENEEYREAACDAAVFVAEKIQGTSPELQDAMKKVIATTTGDDLKARAEKVLERK